MVRTTAEQSCKIVSKIDCVVCEIANPFQNLNCFVCEIAIIAISQITKMTNCENCESCEYCESQFVIFVRIANIFLKI